MSEFGFDKLIARLPAIMQETLQEMAEKTQKYFSESFPKQGIGGEQWQEVQRRIPGTPAYKSGTRDDRTRKILYGRTGKLKDNTEHSIAEVSDHRFVLVNPASYAQLQNQGGINGKGGIVPARPFMVQVDELTEMQLEILKKRTGLMWRVK